MSWYEQARRERESYEAEVVTMALIVMALFMWSAMSKDKPTKQETPSKEVSGG